MTVARRHLVIAVVCVAGLAGAVFAARALRSGTDQHRRPAGTSDAGRPDWLERRVVGAGGAEQYAGVFEVYEDRGARTGRTLHLDVIVLPATGDAPAGDPSAFLASPLRLQRDLVFVDQRGSGGDHALHCALPEGIDVQGTIDALMRVETYRDCRTDLERRADLRHYSTPAAMDDLDEVRAALGYDRINLFGGSYGSRSALVYMRRHPQRVRAAVLLGVVPTQNTNPLYQAKTTQASIEAVFAACEADAACGRAFPRLHEQLGAVVERLDAEPVTVKLRDPLTGEPAALELTRELFAETLRMVLYDTKSIPRVPLLVDLAYEGNYEQLALRGYVTARAIQRQLPLGLHTTVLCGEDVARIEPDAIEQATAGTVLGDARVRRQLAICDTWVATDLPAAFGEPVHSDAPALLITGTFDPVTPPSWAEVAMRTLPNSHHVLFPTSHLPRGPCVDRIVGQFLASPATAPAAACVDDQTLAPFFSR
jgi:pimeloyl-ACP methyl ester carboxylesterase